MLLGALTDTVGNVIDAIGPLGLGVLLAAEAFFPPLPSEAILPLAGFYVDQGRLGFVAALIAATAGSVAAALIFYALGHYGGRPLILSQKRWLRVGERELDVAEGWFDRWGPWIVFGARLVPIVRSVISIPAGAMRMNLLTFALLTTLGSAAWNAALLYAGLALGQNWQRAGDAVDAARPYVLVGALIVAAAGGLWFLRWRRRRVLARPQPSPGE
ncbi:MAG TPA: DedA family protein [Solirubrobacteraceae bacterium]|nr:DedA family protein [Solirubrobacteraceae bacterium]